MWKNQFFEISYVPILIFWMSDSSFQSCVIDFMKSNLQDKWRLFNLYHVSIRFSKVINISSYSSKKSIYPRIWWGYPILESTSFTFLWISFYQNFYFFFSWGWMIRHLNSGQFVRSKMEEVSSFLKRTLKNEEMYLFHTLLRNSSKKYDENGSFIWGEWFVIWIPDNLFGQKWKKFRHFSNKHQKTKKCTCFIHD